MARPWAIPGTPGLEHRIGGIEKKNNSGNISYDPENHEQMVKLRSEKVNIVAKSIPDLVPFGDKSGEVLVVGWGSTYGAIRTAVENAREEGFSVSHVQLRYLNPLPKNLGDILVKFEKVFVPELNMGQLSFILRSKYLIDIIGINKIKGKPFTVEEIYNEITKK